MQTIAILAPTAIDATPDQLARAQRAACEQMMLIARGHSVDSLAVRCAAEMVGSALAPSPAEFELAPTALGAYDRAPQASGRPLEPANDRTAPGWQREDAYKRYLRTILSTQPV